MTVKALLDLILAINTDTQSISAFIVKHLINNPHLFELEIEENAVNNYISKLDDSKKTSLGNRLSLLEDGCNEKIKLTKEVNSEEYTLKVNKSNQSIKKLIEFYDAEMKRESDNLAALKAERNSEQGDYERATQSINNIKADINRANGNIDDINSKIEKQYEIFDSKVFQVLINTVSLLGIFVAIAFAGFGTLTIFTNIDIATWMQSRESFIKNTFVLLATSFFAYNLLLLLIYFIYKLSRPLSIIKKNDGFSKEYISNNRVNLRPFLIIDIILFALNIGLFIWCIRL